MVEAFAQLSSLLVASRGLQMDRKRKRAQQKKMRNMERVHRAANGLAGDDDPKPCGCPTGCDLVVLDGASLSSRPPCCCLRLPLSLCMTVRLDSDGLKIYSSESLKINDQGGDTPLCPFDCNCCF